jgi:hypothetical protein
VTYLGACGSPWVAEIRAVAAKRTDERAGSGQRSADRRNSRCDARLRRRDSDRDTRYSAADPAMSRDVRPVRVNLTRMADRLFEGRRRSST